MPALRSCAASAAAIVAVLVCGPPASAEFIHAAGSPYDVGAEPYSVNPGQFTADTLTDLAVVNGTSSNVHVLNQLTNNGGFGLAAGSPFAVGSGPNFASVADFNSDGRQDIAVANYADANTLSVFLRQANNTFAIEGGPIALGDNSTGLVAGQFNGTGGPDLAVIGSGTNRVIVLLRKPANTGFDQQAPVVLNGSGARYIATGDLDGANGPDLVVTNSSSGNVSVLLNQAGGGFAEATAAPVSSPIAVGTLPQFAVVADFTGDGRADIAVSNLSSDNVTVLQRKVAGGFQQLTGSPFAVGDAPVGLAAADFKETGRLDLAVANSGSSTVSILRNTGTTFTPDPAAPTTPAVGPYGLATGQFNTGDTLPDIAVTSLGTDDVSVLINTAGQAPTNTTRPVVTGVPKVGNQLSCSNGTWTENPTSYSRLWDRGPRSATSDTDPAYVAIDGATGPTYTVQSVDSGQRVRCRVIAMNAKGSGSANSLSKRADAFPPVNLAPPVIVGDAIAGNTITCNPGTWDSDTSDFTYRWLRDGVPINGATNQTYVPTRSRDLDLVTDASADGGHILSCEVQGSNEVGTSVAVRSNYAQSVDGAPYPVRRPTVTLDTSRPNPIGRTVTCSDFQFLDDFGSYGTEQYHWTFTWLRDDAQIPGSDTRSGIYKTTIDDLGKNLSCSVATANVAGTSRSRPSNQLLIPLPRGISGGKIFRAGQNNRYDPVNLMALSGEYTAAVQAQIVPALKRSVTAETARCRGLSGLPSISDPENVKFPVSVASRCTLLIKYPERIDVGAYGVQFLTTTCRLSGCYDLGFALPSADPARTSTIDPTLAAELQPLTPSLVLWDFNGDGRTDATCPGSAPVLRTLPNLGLYDVKATIVTAESAETGVFGSAQYIRMSHPLVKGPVADKDNPFAKGHVALRTAQPFACRTSIDPPPVPESAPCLTRGRIGKVEITGNLCPINLRSIAETDISGLDGDLQAVLQAQADSAGLRSVGASGRSALAELRAYPPEDPFTMPRQISGLLPAQRVVASTFLNTMAGLTTINVTSPTLAGVRLSAGSLVQKDRLGLIASFIPERREFATDQIYVAKGALKVNGVNLDPVGNAALLMVPSDVKQALTTVRSMTLTGRSVAANLGKYPLAQAGKLKAEFEDAAKQKAEALLRESNLADLTQSLKDKLDLGPFKLAGNAKVKLEDDGTATLTAKASFPGLLDFDGSPITTDIVLHGDQDGNVQLKNLTLQKKGLVKLGALNLKDLFLQYDGGLNIRGSLLFPPLNTGIEIQDFHIDNRGKFDSLRLAYLAGSGQGIPIGQGVFITKIGGGLSLKYPPGKDQVTGDATVSVGPSPGGGCATAGIDAGFAVTWAPSPFSVDATGQVQLVCINVANIAFHADATGLVSLKGSFDISLGPIFARGGLGAIFKLPNWQTGVHGTVGVHLPIIGNVSESGELVLSNRGLAGCVKVDLGFLGDVAGGAAVKFINGVPPLSLPQLLAGIRVFTGCDLSAYKPFGNAVRAVSAARTATSFTLEKGTRGVAISVEGAGGAPKVKLRTPSGKVLDFTTTPEGAKLPEGIGFIVEDEDRTVILLGKPEAGGWGMETIPGSPAIVKVEKADILPKPKLTAKLRGSGVVRQLSYTVPRQAGQVVRFVEQAGGAVQTIKTVKGGGRGTVRFTVVEAKGRARTIVAKIEQDGLPRDEVKVASFSAPSPLVGRPAVRVRRSGSRAIITWTRATTAVAYEVSVLTGDGTRTLFMPKGRKVTIGGLARKEGLKVTVAGRSPAGRLGPRGRATLTGTLKLGSIPKVKTGKKPRAIKKA